MTMTKSDRCDAQCPAEAQVKMGKIRDTDDETVVIDELMFCSHHYNRYEYKLTSTGWEITVDKRHEMNQTPSPSASV